MPLIIKNPYLGTQTPRFADPVELVDLFPTLTSLAGLPPPVHFSPPLAGRDLSFALQPHLVRARAAGSDEVWAAQSQITRCWNCTEAYQNTGELAGCTGDAVDAGRFAVPCCKQPRTLFDLMGMSIRERDWRYTLWCQWRANLTVDWSNCSHAELFDHRGEEKPFVPDRGENNNVVHVASYASQVARLDTKLRKLFQMKE